MAMTEKIAKINRIIDGLMGCKLEFEPIQNLVQDQWNQEALSALSSEASQLPFYIEGRDQGRFGFPVRIEGTLAGLAVVEGFSQARPDQLINLAELVSLVLEYGLMHDERVEGLRALEERTILGEEKASNVIPLRPVRTLHPDYSNVIEDLSSARDILPSSLTSTPLLIETNASFPLHRIALEIHELSGRWAMFNIEDMPSDILNSREGLKELGAVTLFIRDLEKLTVAQQLKLAEYLATQPSTEMPQVIAGVNGSTINLSETLGNSRHILPHLLGLFCISNLPWTAQTPDQVTREFISTSLHHLLQRTQKSNQNPDQTPDNSALH
jgi:hypothetical protein